MLSNIVQLHIGEEKPTKEQFKTPVFSKHSPNYKPLGGFWTSPYYVNEYGSSWVQWCLENEYKCGSSNEFPSWLLVPKKEARIYTVDSLQDLKTLVDKYSLPLIEEMPDFLRSFNFEKLSKDYDGIYLTEAGQATTYFSQNPYSLYGWDCECVLWLNWCFIDDSTTFLGLKKYELK